MMYLYIVICAKIKLKLFALKLITAWVTTAESFT